MAVAGLPALWPLTTLALAQPPVPLLLELREVPPCAREGEDDFAVGLRTDRWLFLGELQGRDREQEVTPAAHAIGRDHGKPPTKEAIQLDQVFRYGKFPYLRDPPKLIVWIQNRDIGPNHPRIRTSGPERSSDARHPERPSEARASKGDGDA